MKVITRLFLIGLVTIAGLSLAKPPKPKTSEYFESLGGGFLYKDSKAFYVMDLKILKPPPPGHHLEVTFQNPKKKAEDIKTTDRLEINGDLLSIASPVLACVRNNKKYTVTLELYSDPNKTEKLGTHKQKLEFKMDKGMFDMIGFDKC